MIPIYLTAIDRPHGHETSIMPEPRGLITSALCRNGQFCTIKRSHCRVKTKSRGKAAGLVQKPCTFLVGEFQPRLGMAREQPTGRALDAKIRKLGGMGDSLAVWLSE